MGGSGALRDREPELACARAHQGIDRVRRHRIAHRRMQRGDRHLRTTGHPQLVQQSAGPIRRLQL